MDSPSGIGFQMATSSDRMISHCADNRGPAIRRESEIESTTLSRT
ncbi:hypothetical protein RISK_004324 [Rhodopirellula islandica]|uniref:Uncharacterized protein n=1 Tax=Rhodopirellula islandica TaxID=595434 RepID=A0A0J1BBB3_RHOIS|nr:hypothetical protein RISK_004324 [Rhodopirellula islandica]